MSWIKIDVEEHEFDVLAGAERTLLDCRPVVIAEVKEKNGVGVANIFARLNYRGAYCAISSVCRG